MHCQSQSQSHGTQHPSLLQFLHGRCKGQAGGRRRRHQNAQARQKSAHQHRARWRKGAANRMARFTDHCPDSAVLGNPTPAFRGFSFQRHSVLLPLPETAAGLARHEAGVLADAFVRQTPPESRAPVWLALERAAAAGTPAKRTAEPSGAFNGTLTQAASPASLQAAGRRHRTPRPALPTIDAGASLIFSPSVSPTPKYASFVSRQTEKKRK